MKDVTIVGYYEDNNQPFVFHERVADCRPMEIMKAAFRARKKADSECHAVMQVVEVFDGHLQGKSSWDETLEVAQ